MIHIELHSSTELAHNITEKVFFSSRESFFLLNQRFFQREVDN